MVENVSKGGIILPNGLGGRDRDLKKVNNKIDYSQSDHPAIAEIEHSLAGMAFMELHKHYKGHQWEVRCEDNAQILIIVLPSVSTLKGYHIHIGSRTLTELIHRVKMAGGEILERHGLPTTRLSDQDLVEALDRDIKGNAVTNDA